MAKLIFISPYLKGSTNSARLTNHVRYISTRDGVQTLNDGAKNLPPTKKQEEYIQKLTKKFSEAKLLPEYEEYISAPSRYSASEFIEQAEEIYSSDIDERENFVGYIANRPGVKKIKEHGLWNADGQVPVMQAAMDEVSQHKGNVWRPIISLPREDAERLGYDRVEAWQNLIKSTLIDIADGYKIKPDHLRWYAAMHVKEKHIHVHMIIFSTDPKEGYLTKQGIKQIKSALVRQVYKDDLLNVYHKQTIHRDRLQENALEVMESLIQEMQSGEISNPKIELLINELAERLQNYSGKKVYGYLPPATKRIVDAIVDELASDERIAEAYSLWQDMRDEVFNFYSKAKPERVPLSLLKEFKPVRNMVIREVVQMMEQRQDEPHHTTPEPNAVAESSSTSSIRSTPPATERHTSPPESVSACLVRMLHHMGNIFRDNVSTSGYHGLQLDRKRRKELQEWKIALGHREDDHEDPSNYPTRVRGIRPLRNAVHGMLYPVWLDEQPDDQESGSACHALGIPRGRLQYRQLCSGVVCCTAHHIYTFLPE